MFKLCAIAWYIYVTKITPVTICGDLNFPNIDWYADSVSACISDSTFQNFVIGYNLTQYVHEATSANNNNILDLLLVSHSIYMLNVYTDIPFEISDHCSVSFSLWSHANSEANVNNNLHIFKRYNFVKTDHNGLVHNLYAIEWNHMLSACTDINNAWRLFLNIVYTGINLSAITRKISVLSIQHTFVMLKRASVIYGAIDFITIICKPIVCKLDVVTK